jgi:iron-sulfur cluster repair protein YtfE (RIC family)
MEDLDLATRAGLPDALRVLLAERPREGWTDDPHFDGLVRFWLDRHLKFRDLLGRMQAEARGFIDGAADARPYARSLSQSGSTFLTELSGHHRIEDLHYFPELSAKDRRLERGFAMLDADHHALDGWLSRFADAANAALGAAPGPDAPSGLDDAGRMRDAVGELEEELARLSPLLNRHLADEEELIVPVILLFGGGHG